MDNKEIVLFDRSIRVTSDWYVCVSDAQCAINESRNRVGLKRYNFSQWLKTLYVSDMVCSINESGKDAFKVEFDNDSDKIEQYCHFGVFVNMILSASPVSGVLDNEDWFNDYVCDVYSIDYHVYEHAKILAVGGLWRYTTKNARFSDDIRMMDDIMYFVPDGYKNAVYSLFFDLLGTFYYNWEFALRYAKKLLLGDVEE